MSRLLLPRTFNPAPPGSEEAPVEKPPESSDPEALIRETRERQRRRWIRTALVLLALGAFATATYCIARTAGGASTSHSRFTPVVDARAFAGHGPTRIAGPLFPAHKWPSYFAQIDWSAQFAWMSS